MAKKARTFLPYFRRGLDFVWPHKRYIAMASLCVVGITVFYTISISSIVPFLKVMFARVETLADWVYRSDAQRRLGCVILSDVPKDPEAWRTIGRGIHLVDVEGVGPLRDVAKGGELITRVNGRTGDQYELVRTISELPSDAEITITIRPPRTTAGGAEHTVRLLNGSWATPYLAWLANKLPQGTDEVSKTETVAIVMGTLVIMTILGGICRFVHEYLAGLIAQRALIDIRARGYANLLRLPMSWFAQQQAGDTLSRFAADSTVLEQGIRTLFGKTMREPFKALGVVALAAVVSVKLLLGAAIIAPVAGILIRKLGRKLRRAQKRTLAAWGGLIDLLEEKINGIRVVKGYHMERREALQFFRRHRELMRQQLKITRIDAFVSPMLEVMGVAAVGGIAVTGGYLVFNRQLDPEVFFQLVFCIAAIFDPIRKLSNVNNRLQAADAAAQRLFDILDLPPEERADGRVVIPDLPRLRQGIEFRGVSFAYPSNPDRLVLTDINLKVKAGEIVAIVGPNGSGKTTLCSLLTRFFQPLKGQIYLDGIDIAQASVGSLRKQIGLVTQDTVIFTDTARANIAYGEKHAREEDILQAARTAYADEFIRDLHTEYEGHVTVGYDAVISSRSLSGGQKQRIAIARAVLRDPAILIFDEATSQIDAESEMKIQQALHKIMHGRTTFVIAHRFSTISQAHRIVVMDVGRIVAVGTHDVLFKGCPLYRTLYETQFREAG